MQFFPARFDISERLFRFLIVQHHLVFPLRQPYCHTPQHPEKRREQRPERTPEQELCPDCSHAVFSLSDTVLCSILP